jgi:hypothetical protein
MAKTRAARWMLIAAAVLVTLGIAGLGAMHMAARSLEPAVLEALGPESELDNLRVGFTSIVITGIRVGAPKGWPAEYTLSADRVVVVPDLRQLLSRHLYITSVTIENGYISAVRPKGGGGLKILPGTVSEKKKKAERTGREAEIDAVELRNCVLEFFDATVSESKKLRLDAVNGLVSDIQLPKLDSQSPVELNGVIKGPVRQGTMAISGWVNVAKKASDLTTRVRNMDLALFEPYVVQKTRAGIDKGSFNLDIQSSTRNNQVNGQGKLVVTGLKLKAGESGLSNIPQRAVIGALADENEKIELAFELEGNLDDPAFSLTEGLGLKTATGVLKALGLGFEALIRAFYILVSGFGAAF